jgi:hemolysin activation/secretion protein
VSLTALLTQRIDLENQVLIGGDNGLRGYPLRYQLGDARAQLKIEERVYTDWSLWRLFNIGGAAFFDAGRTYGNNPLGVPQLGWLRDVGFGLRLGNDRSSLGNVIHIDLATPLDGENLSRLQFLVSTEATL